jgi:hypothetical protein
MRQILPEITPRSVSNSLMTDTMTSVGASAFNAYNTFLPQRNDLAIPIDQISYARAGVVQ